MRVVCAIPCTPDGTVEDNVETESFSVQESKPKMTTWVGVDK